MAKRHDVNILDALGGASTVAALLDFDALRGPNRINNWYSRGIPWRQRPRIAELCEGAGVPIPKDFLVERDK